MVVVELVLEAKVVLVVMVELLKQKVQMGLKEAQEEQELVNMVVAEEVVTVIDQELWGQAVTVGAQLV